MNPTQAGSFTTPVSNALKATIQHHDSAVIIHARGEIDAANEHTLARSGHEGGRGHHRAGTTRGQPQRPRFHGLLRSRRPCSRGRTVSTPGRGRAPGKPRPCCRAHHPRLRIRRRAARTPDHGVRAVSDISGGLPQTHFCFSGKLVGHVDNLVALPGELVCAR